MELDVKVIVNVYVKKLECRGSAEAQNNDNASRIFRGIPHDFQW